MAKVEFENNYKTKRSKTTSAYKHWDLQAVE